MELVVELGIKSSRTWLVQALSLHNSSWLIKRKNEPFQNLKFYPTLPNCSLWPCASRNIWFWNLPIWNPWFDYFSSCTRNSYNITWECNFRWLLWFWWVIFLEKTYKQTQLQSNLFSHRNQVRKEGLVSDLESVFRFLIEMISNDYKTYILISYGNDCETIFNQVGLAPCNSILAWCLIRCITDNSKVGAFWLVSFFSPLNFS